MRRKYKFNVTVLAVNFQGEEGRFRLVREAPGAVVVDESHKAMFFGEKLKAYDESGSISDYVVTKVLRMECVPEPLFISVKKDLLGYAKCDIRLGSYNCSTDPDPYYRNHPLTNFEASFHLQAGEGIVFNDARWGQDYMASYKVSSLDYIVTYSDAIWTFPRSEWVLRLVRDAEVDYHDSEIVEHSLPEQTFY